MKIKKIKFPIVLKPINEGSSLGVEIFKNFSNLNRSAKYLLKKYEQIIVEQFIGGQEIQVAVLTTNQSERLN